MKNLYETIISLVDEKEELNKQGGTLKYDVRRGDPVAKEKYDKMAIRYKQVEEQLDSIENEYAIGIEEMGKIISKNMGETYIPKIFREVYEKDGERYYTERFIACYINKRHPYYSNEKYEISVLENEFNGKLLESLDKTNAIMFSHSSELNYRPLVPSWAFQGTNFIRMYTYGRSCALDFCRGFIAKVEPMLRAELENTNIIANDDNFNQGI